jgi:hypothetical protein
MKTTGLTPGRFVVKDGTLYLVEEVLETSLMVSDVSGGESEIFTWDEPSEPTPATTAFRDTWPGDSLTHLYPGRKCPKHGYYNQEHWQDDVDLYGQCGKCEDERSDYEDFEISLRHYTATVSDVEEVLKGRSAPTKGDPRVRRAFNLLNAVLGELVIIKNQKHAELV